MAIENVNLEVVTINGAWTVQETDDSGARCIDCGEVVDAAGSFGRCSDCADEFVWELQHS